MADSREADYEELVAVWRQERTETAYLSAYLRAVAVPLCRGV